jgi:hypothetical protein
MIIGKLLIVLNLVLLLSSMTILVYAQADQVNLKPTDDTFVNSYNRDTNYGSGDTLDILRQYVYYEGQNNLIEDIIWLKFNLSSVPQGALVDAAVLQLYSTFAAGTNAINAYSCSSNAWNASTLTFSNMPSFNTTKMDSTQVTSSSQWYNWSVIDSVRNALNSNAKSVTVVLRESSIENSSSASFASTETPVNLTDYSPQLTVHWSGVVPEISPFIFLSLLMISSSMTVALYKYSKKKVSTQRA